MNSSNYERPPLVEGNRAWPRTYLSWSQFECWRKGDGNGHWEYFRRYLYNEPLPTTPQMRLGSEMAAMLEHRDVPTDDGMLEHYRRFLPTYSHKEAEIKANYGPVPLLAKPDGFTVREAFKGIASPLENYVSIDLGEYKTGKLWTQERADTHRQIDLYCLVLMDAYKLKANEIRPVVHWIPTFRDIGTGRYRPTGEIFDFVTPRSENQLIQSGGEFIRVWHEIGEAYGAECRALGVL